MSNLLGQMEWQYTLATATARYDELRLRDSLHDPEDPNRATPPLTQAEALELLALGEVIARKAGHGRQLAVRTARQAGASWAQIGQALGTTRQSAWEAHIRWIDAQERFHDATGSEGLDPVEVQRARDVASSPTQ